MVNEIIYENKFPREPNKKISANQFIEFMENRQELERYELINGKIYMMASANVGHQDILLFLGRKLGNYLEGKKCRAFVAALDVVLFEKKKEDKDKSQNVVQPDVFVVCDPDKIKKDRIYGAPDLIIEVVSPSNEAHDYFRKYELYKKYGVREYWIVNPESGKIFAHTDGLKEVAEYSFDDKIKVGIFDEEDFYIDFKEL